MTDAGYVVKTGRDGQLDGTSAEEFDAILERLRGSANVVIYFHGGLVDEAHGVAIAERLT